MRFFSQLGQDSYLLENFFRGKRGGIFVDIGAYDGETYSNTLFFERFMGWTGLCIEPLPTAFAKLSALRRASCERVCVSDFEGEAEFVEAEGAIDEKMLSGLADKFDPRHIERLERSAYRQTRWRTPVTRLSTLLAKHSLFAVDYCSIDTEGAELSILSGLDLDRFRVSVFTVEHNYDDDRVHKLMEGKGYAFVARLEQDLVFRRRDVKALPRITVVCAVPAGVADRDALLRAHSASLARQTVPIEPIYVFGGGGEVPDWLAGRAVSAGAELTRAQSVNVALSMVATPLAMTLDLADRLAPDAAETLEREMQLAGATAAGGDWRLCDSQAETDEVEACYPAHRLPIGGPPGTPRRLGSSAEGFESLGPAAMWRVEAHLRAPRYPWRLRDGTPLLNAADRAWCSLLTDGLRQKVVRVPAILGNRLALPEAGTAPAYDERSLLGDPGVSLL